MSVDPFLLLVHASLNLPVFDLPPPAPFGHRVPLSVQSVPLCHQAVTLRIEFGQFSVDLLLLLIYALMNLFTFDLPLPALFGHRVSLSFQSVPLRCQGAALRLKLGQFGRGLSLLLVGVRLGLLLDLPSASFLRQCVPLGLQLAPLGCQGAALRFEIGEPRGKLFALLVDLSLNLFMLDVPLPTLFSQCVALSLEAILLRR